MVFYEAETAGSFLVTIKAHDEALDLAAFGEQFVNLLLGGIEGPMDLVRCFI